MLKDAFPNMRQVGIHIDEHIDDWKEAWLLFNGFKDGFTYVTPHGHKLRECNFQWSEFNKVYYIDYFYLFNSAVLVENWKQENR